MKKAVLFGAGKRCKDVMEIVLKSYVIECIVDNDKTKWGINLSGIEIKSPACLNMLKDIMVIVTPIDNKEIIEQLIEMQLENISYIEGEKIKKVSYCVVKKKELQKHEMSVGKFLKMVSETEQIILQNVCFRSGGSGVLDYAFLYALMKYFSLNTYLEIGTYIGESINNVAAVADKCFSITAPPEAPYSMRNFCKTYGIVDFSNRLVNLPNVIQFLADSKEFDFSTIKDTIDIYFIDGDHSIEGIENDTRKIMECKSENAFIVWHDVKKEGHQINEITIEAIYNIIGNEGFKNFYICDTCKCGIYIPDKYRSFFDELCNYDRNTLFTYQLTMKINEK